jgi:hypothetical protein
VVPGVAVAGRLNTTYLVPAYEACPRGTTTTTRPSFAPCTPARRESSFTFESAMLRSSPARYIKGGAVTFVVLLRGVRDPSGSLVTTDTADPADDFAVVSPPGQTTLTFADSTFAAGVLSGPVRVRFDLRKGAAKVVFRTPSAQPIPDGIVVEGGSVAIVDKAGKRLATVGAQSPPAAR